MWTLALSLSMLGAPAELHGFPVNAGGRNTGQGVLVVDLDGDGVNEIVVIAGEGVSVVEASGQVRAGFPVSLHDATDKGKLTLAPSPLACDVDGDGKPEIVVAADNRRLFALNGRGELVKGFPLLLAGLPRGAAACVSDKKGARPALFLTTDDGGLWRLRSGEPAQEIAKVQKGVESGVAAADLDGDGVLEIIAVGGDSRLYVVDASGKPKAGVDYRMSFRSSGVPAVGDIDDDGKPEIIVASQDFKIHALGLGGSLAGFPAATDYRLYAGAALADLDNDGVLDIVVGSGDRKLYAVHGDGTPVSGFPATLDERIVADAAVGDLDRDGRPEIAVVTQAGSLYLVGADGRTLSGFPFRLGGKAECAPAMADLDNDGQPELIAVAADGLVHALSFKASGKAEKNLVAWAQLGHDAGHSGRAAPFEGRFIGLGWANAEPFTNDPLILRYSFIDTDWEAEGQTQIRWYRDDQPVRELDNQKQVPPEKTKKHERWRYTLQDGGNFKAYGEGGVLTRLFKSGEINIKNSAPEKPDIDLSPRTPSTTEPLVASITRPSVDADGDTIEYRHVWLIDGRPQKLLPSETRIDPARTQKNTEWRLIVVPFDGEVEGAIASAAVTIKNTPPGKPQIAFAPPAPRIDDVTKVQIVVPALDDDKDPLHYRYRYSVDGVLLPLPNDVDSVPTRLLRKHQKLRVLVTAWDDEAAGGQIELETEVQNTPPVPPVVRIWPDKPRTAQDLALAVVSQAADADLDGVTLKHQWLVDGAPIDLPTTVPASATKKGQRWRIEVTPQDGEAAGKPVSAETLIENTPPTPPVVVLDRYVWLTDDEIVPRLQRPAADDDGDAVLLKYVWKLAGKPQPFPPSKDRLTAADTKRDQSWELEITPFDGTVDGAPTRLRFVIDNTAPSTPVIALSPLRPTTRDRVLANVTTASSDKDGDAVSYHYRWFKNGEAQATWAVSKSALEPLEAKEGEQWRVEVRGYDGQKESEPAAVELMIENQAPDAPLVAVMPAMPRTTDELACQLTKPGADADGDKLSYRTHWLVDGKPIDLERDTARAPATLTKKHQKWRCEVEVFDGTAPSATARAADVEIADAPPSAPVVTILPVEPRTDDELTCALKTASSDDDLDVIRYRYAWRVDGKPYTPAGDPTRVPKEATSRGQNWECTITPNDGELDGPSHAAVTVIRNSVPSVARAEVRPEKRLAGVPISCEVTRAAVDADGDNVRYLYAWYKDGVAQSFAPTSVEVPGRLVKAGDLWRCAVTANDGADNGPAYDAPDVAIEAAPAVKPTASRDSKPAAPR